MVSLLLDSCTEHGVVVFYENNVQKFAGIIPEGVHNSKFMMVEIDKGFKQLEIKPADLKYIAVTIGPGSYTGVRVGVVIAKTLGYAAKIPIIPLSSLNAYVPYNDGLFISMIDARIGGVYIRTGMKKDGGVTWLTPPEMCELTALKSYLAQSEMIVTPNASAIQKKIHMLYPDLILNWIEQTPNIDYLIKEAENSFQDGNGCDESKIEIAYLRQTQAEIERDKEKTG